MRGFRHIGPLATLDRSMYALDDLLFLGVTENGPIREGWYRARAFDPRIVRYAGSGTESDHVFVATAIGEDAFCTTP